MQLKNKKKKKIIIIPTSGMSIVKGKSCLSSQKSEDRRAHQRDNKRRGLAPEVFSFNLLYATVGEGRDAKKFTSLNYAFVYHPPLKHAFASYVALNYAFACHPPLNYAFACHLYIEGRNDA